MGCNGSKSEDINKAARERQSSRPAGPGAQGPSKSRPGPSASSSAPDEGKGAAYTDKREEESDYLKNLVEKTSQNLIDVSQTNAPFDPAVSENRMKEYKAKQVLKATQVAVVSLPILSLPTPSKALPGPEKVLSGTAITSSDRELLLDAGGGLSTAFERMSVRDCGDLVVPFGSAT